MQAFGHDTYVAILLGVAEVVAAVREELPGTVKFLFQPAEEGPPKGENGGAKMMIEEGALQNPQVDAVIGLHISKKAPSKPHKRSKRAKSKAAKSMVARERARNQA